MKKTLSGVSSVFKNVQRVLLVLLWIILIFVISGSFIAWGKFKSLELDTKDLPVLTDPSRSVLPGTVKVISSDGKLLGKTSQKRRIMLNQDMMGWKVRKAVIAIEDQRFYSHSGIDFQAAVRALWVDLRSGEYTQGASTITMQYIRNIYLNQEKTRERKLKEIALALQLEGIWSKERILTAYLNTVYYSNGNYGIEAASRDYFNKNSIQLSLAQAALLTAIPNDPATYDPRINPKKTWQRAIIILDEMFAQNMISKNQWVKAKLKMPKIYKSKYKNEIKDIRLFQAANEEAKKHLPPEVFAQGGFDIHISIDYQKQKQISKQLDNVYGGTGGMIRPLIAATFIDPQTGRIKIMTANKRTRYFDYASEAIRQPGSTVKLFTTLAYFSGGGSFNDPLDNSPLEVKNGQNASYTITPTSSTSDVSGALRFSQNPAFWRLFQKAEPKKVLALQKRLGLSGMDANPAAALGGVKHGVSTKQMAGALAGISNNGKFIQPHLVVRITDSNKNTIYSDIQLERKQAVAPEYAKRINAAGQKVVTEGLPQLKENITLAQRREVVGKTGTTEDNADAWFAGYTSNLAGAVWTGYERGRKPLRDVAGVSGEVYGATIPAKSWNRIAQDLSKNLANKKFDKPTGAIEIPKLKGTPTDQVQNKLQQYGLYNFQLKAKFNPKAQQNTVLSTSPKAKTFVDKNRLITIYYQTSERSTPDFIGKNYVDVYDRLGKYIKLKPKLVVSEQATGTILSQWPLPGETIKAGQELQVSLATKRAPAKIITKQVEYVPTDSELANLRKEINQAQQRSTWIEGTSVMPNLRGLKAVDAAQVLSSLELNANYPYAGIVTGQSVQSGKRISKGSRITLQVESEEGE